MLVPGSDRDEHLTEVPLAELVVDGKEETESAMVAATAVSFALQGRSVVVDMHRCTQQQKHDIAAEMSSRVESRHVGSSRIRVVDNRRLPPSRHEAVSLVLRACSAAVESRSTAPLITLLASGLYGGSAPTAIALAHEAGDEPVRMAAILEEGGWQRLAASVDPRAARA